MALGGHRQAVPQPTLDPLRPGATYLRPADDVLQTQGERHLDRLLGLVGEVHIEDRNGEGGVLHLPRHEGAPTLDGHGHRDGGIAEIDPPEGEGAGERALAEAEEAA